jgi:DNA polymerase-1
MPAALAEQWRRAPELLRSFGWTVADTAELEADDLLLSYARTERAAGGRTLVLTADRDLYQALDDHTALLELKPKGPPVEVDPREVQRRYGVGPELVPDFIALRGDPSDGLPGAPGIGAKTARDLLLEYGSLEGVLAAAAGVASAAGMRPRIAAALREHAEQLRAFLQIARLVPVDVARPADRATDYAAGARAASEHGMARLAQRLARQPASTA